MKNSVHQTLADDMTRATSQQQTTILFDYIVRRGQSFYDESVTQLEHALQCANQAHISEASPTQITSALLHDLGHFLLDEHNADKAFLADDLNHEAVGASFLEPFFPDAVTTPVRLHVPAKRVPMHDRYGILRRFIRSVKAEFPSSRRDDVGR